MPVPGQPDPEVGAQIVPVAEDLDVGGRVATDPVQPDSSVVLLLGLRNQLRGQPAHVVVGRDRAVPPVSLTVSSPPGIQDTGE